MPLPLIVGGVTAAVNLIGAKKSSDASKNAAKVQIAASDKAQQYNQQVYNDQKQLMDPYIRGGQDSFARLMSQHWGTPAPAGMTPGVGGTNQMLGDAASMYTPRPVGAGQTEAAQMARGGLGSMGGPPAGPMGAPSGGAPAGGLMVPMVGPDGSRNNVPAAQVQEAIRRGAKVVQ